MSKVKDKIKASVTKAIVAVAVVMLAPLTGSALDTSYYASDSRLNTGRWVKIRVTKEGVQQITYDQLRSWGFSNPENVKVYGYGGTAFCDHTFSKTSPDDIQPTLSLHVDNKILFFGDADVRVRLTGKDSYSYYTYTVDRNYTSLAGYYLLTEDEVGGEVPSAIKYTVSESDPLSTHYCVNLYEEEKVAPGNEGCIFHTKTYSAGNTIEVSFDIVDYAEAESNRDNGSVTFEIPALYTTTGYYKVPGVTSENSVIPVSTSVCSIRNCTDSSKAFNTGSNRSRFNITAGESIADGTYKFLTTTPTATAISYLALDRAVMSYPRKNIFHANSGGLLMHFPDVSSDVNFVVEGASANTYVWNVTSPSNVYAHEVSYDSELGTVTGSFDHVYAAYNTTYGECRLAVFNTDEEQNSVEYVGEVKNQNIHGDETPDMVIITTEELLQNAEELAELHRQHDGLVVNVYTQQQLFDEFAAGTPTPMALRRALKMFYDRDSEKLKYLLMYGMGYYDFRQITGNPGYIPLISFEVEPVTTTMKTASTYANINFMSDDYFGFLDDSDTPTYIMLKAARANLAVGRIPAINGSYAHDVNTKIANYIKNPLPAEKMMRVMVCSDDEDDNKHLDQSLDLVEILKTSRPTMTTTQAHVMIYPHTTTNADALVNKVVSTFKDGVGLYCYNGHGSAEMFASQALWSINLANNTDYDYLPIAMLATCSSINVDRSESAVANAMLQKNNGGAIGVVGASRVVYLEDNKYVCDAFAQAYAEASGKTTLGEIYRQCRNIANASISGTSEDAIKSHTNLMCYMLIGDPAVSLTFPEKSVVINTVDDAALDADAVAVQTGSLVKVKASVTDENGVVQDNFNGKATVTLYEAPHTVDAILVNTSTEHDETVTLDEDVLASVVTKVVNGQIEANLFIPNNTYESTSENLSRMTVIATDNDGNVAVGSNSVIYIDGENSSDVSVGLPEISDLYVEHEDKTVGSATVYAVINIGDAGLNVSSAIGYGASLSVDGLKVTNYTLPIEYNADGTANLQYDLSELSEGVHTVTLSVADNAGNRVVQTVSFTVKTVVSMTANKQNAHDDVTFAITHNYASQPTCRLIIENMSGKTVFTDEFEGSSYTWNLKGSDNVDVPDGFYSAYLMATDSNTHTSSEKVKFVVTR